jgi:C-terminal processing protease CtpA/Prc
MKKLFLTVLSLACFFSSSLRAAEKGWFGFGVTVAGSGYFNPTVKSITVDSVAPHSPASEQRMAVGDQVIQVESTEVSGHKARELKALMQKQPGESVRLRLKRPTGEIYSVTLIAVKPPA